MDCVCRQPLEMQKNDVIQTKCLPRGRPIKMKVLTLHTLREDNLQAQTECHAYMDSANNKLLTAFDPVFNRMYRATLHVESSIDFVFHMFDVDAGNCANYQTSPYILALLPEPSDYFLGCMNTYDCRARCLDTYEAFEVALASTTSQPPSFVYPLSQDIQSRFFSTEDIEQGLDKAPFEIFGMAELDTAACQVVCSDVHELNRCVAVTGKSVTTSRVALAYYCMPQNFMDSVFEYAGSLAHNDSAPAYEDDWSDETITNLYLLTTDRIVQNRREMLLATTTNTNTSLHSLWAFTSSGARFLIMSTEKFDPELHTEDVFHTLSSVRVVPARGQANFSTALVFVIGTQHIKVNEKVTEVSKCRKYDIFPRLALDIDVLDRIDEDFAFSTRVIASSCDNYIDDVYAADMKIVCLGSEDEGYCTDQLRIPCLLYTSPSPRDRTRSRMPSSA